MPEFSNTQAKEELLANKEDHRIALFENINVECVTSGVITAKQTKKRRARLLSVVFPRLS
jgi:hypothetical protein